MNATLRSHLRDQDAYLATADAAGRPHLAVGHLDEVDADRLRFSGWFCPQTLANLEVNSSVAVAVLLDADGYQLSGTVAESQMDAVMDGYLPGEEPGLPQTRYRLRIDIERVVALGDRPHTDAPLGQAQ